MWSDRKKIAFGEKYFERKNSQINFCCLYVKLATVQNLKASEQIPFEFQLFKVSPSSEKKLIRENNAKNSTIHFIQNSRYSVIASYISFHLI